MMTMTFTTRTGVKPLAETMPVRELQDILPDVLPYLALEQGYRFMIDADDYEDVWKEGDES